MGGTAALGALLHLLAVLTSGLATIPDPGWMINLMVIIWGMRLSVVDYRVWRVVDALSTGSIGVRIWNSLPEEFGALSRDLAGEVTVIYRRRQCQGFTY